MFFLLLLRCLDECASDSVQVVIFSTISNRTHVNSVVSPLESDFEVICGNVKTM